MPNCLSKYLLFFLVVFTLPGYTQNLKANNQPINHFGHQLESSLASGNPYFFNLSFDKEALLQKVFIKHPEKQNSEYNNGFSEGIRFNLDLGSSIINSLHSGGRFSYMHSYELNGEVYMVFRLINETGIDYYLFTVSHTGETIKLTDLYISSMGMYISQTTEAIYLQHMPAQHAGEHTSHETAVDKLEIHLGNARYKRAYKAWLQIPEAERSDKELLSSGLLSAEHTSREAFLDCIRFWDKNYPEEPAKYLIPLNGLIAYKAFPHALKYINALDSSIGSDPVLNLLRADIMHQLGEDGLAIQTLKDLIQEVPDFETSYINLLEFHLEAKQYTEATAVMDQMLIAFRAYKEDLQPLIANHPEFTQSSVYRQWINN